MERYIRQLALPEMNPAKQEKLARSTLLWVGAGGLGCPALPYLAGAGVGRIVIADHDTVEISNLHRQTLYTTAQAGQSKAQCTGDYLRALNPDIHVDVITERLTQDNAGNYLSAYDFDLLIDGSDNFETKDLMNALSVALHVPLISASVERFSAHVGLFRGYAAGRACYRCLFPVLPQTARTCNEAGLLGTAAGLSGMLQAHMALMVLLALRDEKSPDFYTINCNSIRIEPINISKNPACPHCAHAESESANSQLSTPKPNTESDESKMPPTIHVKDLLEVDTVIIDVRQPEELISDPLTHPLIRTAPIHIPLPELVARLDELPQGKRLAFVCAGNVRSAQAAHYLHAQGRTDVCILDKFSL